MPSPLRYHVHSNVITHHKLGTGVYGTTYRVSSNGKSLSGKILHIPTGEDNVVDKIKEQFKNACSFLFQIQHPNLVKFVGISEETSHCLPMMLFELESENFNVFLKRTKGTLTIFTKLSLCHDIAKGLDHLHTNVQIVHKNLHASNILVSGIGQAKISDFALSHIVSFDEVHLDFPTKGSLLAYIAPEVLKNHQNTSYQSDIFSLGILSLQLVIEASPFNGNYKEIQQWISKCEPLHNEPFLNVNHCIQGCLSDNLINRPSASVVCQLLEETKRSPIIVAYDALNSKVRNSFISMLGS